MNAAAHGVIARIGAVAFPPAEIERLHLAEAERRLDLVNSDRKICLRRAARLGFVAHEASFRAG